MLTERRVQIGEQWIAYAEGPVRGPPFVLLHGGGARWQHGETFVRLLAERWHVFAPDLRGHGCSGHVPGRYLLCDYVEDVAALLGALLHEPAVLYGHSLGGEIAVMASAKHPALVRALIVGDAPLTIEDHVTEEPAHRAMNVRYQALVGRPVDEIVAALQQMPFLVPGETRARRALDVLGREHGWFRLQATSLHLLDRGVLDAVLAGPDVMLAGYDPHVVLPSIACPALLLQADPAHGGVLRDDEVALARRLNSSIGHVRLAGIGHSLHGPPDQASQVLAAIEPFLGAL